jgi:HSP20 family protein
MATIRTIRLRWLHGALQDVTSYQLAVVPFSPFAPSPWEPAINAYRCDDCIRICVELAGVDRSQIDVTVRQRRISIQGVRDVPEPKEKDHRVVQTIAMEIDYGAFQRELELPEEIDVQEVQADQRNGLLWIHLPLKK